MHKQAFSLVELSIVLIILGLLTGGVLVGQSLIEAAEINKTLAQYRQYHSAAHSFREKYLALPGDMTNAADFWGAADGGDGIGMDCYTTAATGRATCNGNGDGEISKYYELWRSWQHLSNAGMVEGTYASISGPGNPQTEAVPGYNVPRAAYGGDDVGWTFAGVDHIPTSLYFRGNNKNALIYGRFNSTRLLTTSFLTPREARRFDSKIDDGVAGSGNVTAGNLQSCCPTGTVATDYDAPYRLTSTNEVCTLLFRTGL